MLQPLDGAGFKMYVQLTVTKCREKKVPNSQKHFLIKPCPEDTDKRNRASCDY